MRIIAVPVAKNLATHKIRVEFRDADSGDVLTVREFTISRPAAKDHDWLRRACGAVIDYLDAAVPFFASVPLEQPIASIAPTLTLKEKRLRANVAALRNVQSLVSLGMIAADEPRLVALLAAVRADFDLATVFAPQLSLLAEEEEAA